MANMDAAPQVILHTSMGDITVEVLTYYLFLFLSPQQNAVCSVCWFCCLTKSFVLLVLLIDKGSLRLFLQLRIILFL
jgi:hypothetical protein